MKHISNNAAKQPYNEMKAAKCFSQGHVTLRVTALE